MSARRGWAWPLVPLYWAGLWAKDRLRRASVLPERRLAWPVVSVGSLSAGGAGKTPVVIALAELLRARGWAVDVLSRGYGRAADSGGVLRVDLAAEDAAARFGDEPVVIAQRAGVPVWVGANRYAAGMVAEAAAGGAGVHLLDDGFQHRQLARDVDVVLVTAEDLDDALLPAGNRREPVSALGRAGAIVIRDAERAVLEPRVRTLVHDGVPVWVVRRRLVLDAGEGRLLAFCGIARPEGFFAMLRAAGVPIAGEVRFPDHHRYRPRDLRGLVETCHLESCGGFVTTEKDAVKLGPEWRAMLEQAGPLRVARLEVEFAEPDAVAAAVEARLR